MTDDWDDDCDVCATVRAGVDGAYLDANTPSGAEAVRSLSAAASLLADANRIEDSWVLQGVTDALSGSPPSPPGSDYDEHYYRGYRAIAALVNS